MEKEASLLGSAGNYYLVHIEGRKYPALAVQGDSLKVLHETVVELADYISSEGGEDMKFAFRELSGTIESMISAFEQMSFHAGKDLPYVQDETT
jgi:hypothetical protein